MATNDRASARVRAEDSGTGQNPAAPPETSIVIRTYNEERWLPGLLDGIEDQTYRDFEVLVVDSGSYDRTPEIARERGARLIEIESRNFTFGHSLNVGIEAARGDRIAIISAHTRPMDEAWLEPLVAPLDDPDVAMVYGQQRGTEESKFPERVDFHRTFGTERREVEPPDFFANNANSAIRRDLWREHPFDETLPGLEDIEWARHWIERGRSVIYEPDAGIYHIHRETWPQVRHRYYREALAARWIGVKGEEDLPREVLAEARRLVGDLIRAAGQGRVSNVVGEIVRFRWEKARGTVRGLRDGAELSDPRKREELYFEDAYEAVVIGDRGEAELEQVERPPLKPGDVLVNVAYVGVCRTDLEIFDGTLGYYRDGDAEYPIIPGHEFSGVVAKTGVNAEGVDVGDRVVVECLQSCGKCEACSADRPTACADRRELGVLGRDGAYARFVTVPSEYVHRVPSGVGLKEAALAEPLAVVLKGIERVGDRDLLERADRCGVVGVGPIGHLAAQAVAQQGLRVTGFDRDGSRREALEAVDGPIAVSDGLTGLGACDLVLEATGSSEALKDVLRHSPAGATVLLLGLPYGRSEVDFEKIVAYDRALVGSVASSGRHFERALRLLPELDMSRLTDEVLRLEEYREAWRRVRERDALKVLLEVEGDGPLEKTD